MGAHPGRLTRIAGAIKGKVRYRLLVLVLFPILLIMPIALAIAISWGKDYTYEQLFIKVKTDLSVSHDTFNRIQRNYLSELESLAESYTFRLALENRDQQAIQQQVSRLKAKAEFSYL
jgi:two-component system NtrC family sensor kinase